MHVHPQISRELARERGAEVRAAAWAGPAPAPAAPGPGAGRAARRGAASGLGTRPRSQLTVIRGGRR